MADKPPRAKAGQPGRPDDATLAGLSKADRRKLGIDAWEPSLLRQLLAAQNRLRKRK